MKIDMEITVKWRDVLHGLNLNDPESKKIYDNAVFHFTAGLETPNGEAKLKVHNDGKDYDIIGYGFNMSDSSAKQYWKDAIGSEVDFNAAKIGEISITEEYDQVRSSKLCELQNIYGPEWFKLKPNEQAMIEDLYYNGGTGLVGKRTRFYKHIVDYANNGNPDKLTSVITEVVEHSISLEDPKNPNILAGLQKRRNFQAALGDSNKCPIYLKPGETVESQNMKLVAVVGFTTTPRKHGNLKNNSTKSDRYYIWCSKLDEKVRKSHLENEGRIFDINNPPVTANPGDNYNCRCKADFYIPDYIDVQEIFRKYHHHLLNISGFIAKSTF